MTKLQAQRKVARLVELETESAKIKEELLEYFVETGDLAVIQGPDGYSLSYVKESFPETWNRKAIAADYAAMGKPIPMEEGTPRKATVRLNKPRKKGGK